MVTTPSLDEGEISVVGKGLETESGTYWVFYGNKYLFRLVYNKGGQGTGSSYILNSSKKMEEYLQYSVNRITTYGLWGENVITVSAGDTSTKDADGDAAKGLLVNYLNANTGLTTSKAYICEDFLGNGEYVTFSGFVEANGKLYTSVIPMGMSRYGVKAFSDKITDTELIAKASGGSGADPMWLVKFLQRNILIVRMLLFIVEIILATHQLLHPPTKWVLPVVV